jgi:hypothetical protein
LLLEYSFKPLDSSWGIYSVTKMVTYPIDITLPDVIYPYHFEGITLMTVGPIKYRFGYKYKEPIKGKNALIKIKEEMAIATTFPENY